ncbi:hypothetical protein KC19_4G209900 [Ceratodon purpureus]|uniref:Uncharacterized protein n=1 Tax=Ceratodon purpureus TaxID=3225 RepID=A0A8T0IB03_CERPU|nr:hypothetical protein KC19_4G209900 [Ceratodon purpureus]
MVHREVRKPGQAMELPEGEHDEELGLLEYISFRDKQAKLESHRWAGYSESHPAIQVLDILQESTSILRKHNGVLLTVALALAVPLSTLLLSHVLLLLPLMENLVRSVQSSADQRFPSHQTGYRKLAEAVMATVVDIPLSALFSPLLKAGVAYVVATNYGRKKLKLADVFDNLQKTWSLLLHTFMWTSSVYLTFAITFTTTLWFASRAGSASSTFFSNLALLIATLTILALAAALAFANVACNLAYVVSVLEGTPGKEALLQSVRLLKPRIEVALLLFLVTNVNATILDILFEFHIIRGDASIIYDKYWEAPLLVCMHSFVHLFDAIMVCVLYFICKSSEPDQACRQLPHPAVEHFSSSLTELADVRSPRSPFSYR